MNVDHRTSGNPHSHHCRLIEVPCEDQGGCSCRCLFNCPIHVLLVKGSCVSLKWSAGWSCSTTRQMPHCLCSHVSVVYERTSGSLDVLVHPHNLHGSTIRFYYGSTMHCIVGPFRCPNDQLPKCRNSSLH